MTIIISSVLLQPFDDHLIQNSSSKHHNEQGKAKHTEGNVRNCTKRNSTSAYYEKSWTGWTEQY